MSLIVVSNRLPVKILEKDGAWKAIPAAGGLVTAMTPVLKQRGGIWIGWPGGETAGGDDLTEVLGQASETAGYDLHPVELTEEDVAGFYHGFSNGVLWPVLHDLHLHAHFEESYWKSYREVNEKFARVIAEHAGAHDAVWIHDYHLMLVASALRQIGASPRTEFFLHTPFPPLDIFSNLPWRSEILQGLLEFDVVGFQTVRDRDNYLHCLNELVPGVAIEGSGRVLRVRLGGRVAHVGAFPISIDAAHFETMARSGEVAEEAGRIATRAGNLHVVLGVDRLDYTKGIPHRLKGFRRALEREPSLEGHILMVQLVVPSREPIPEYMNLKAEIDQLVGEINGDFTRSGWAPIHYLFRSLSQTDLVALYRAAQTMLVTPLKDGMNLVAKEYCASNVDESGALILSEFAGTAAQLGEHTLLVNPHDTEGMADAIIQAYQMPPDERQRRMRKLRNSIAAEDIFWWVDSFLQAAEPAAV
jgi:trehalose 6-phosphate synthase